jgi:hypothetical protein
MAGDTPLHDWLLPRLGALVRNAERAGFDRDTVVAVITDLITGPPFNGPGAAPAQSPARASSSASRPRRAVTGAKVAAAAGTLTFRATAPGRPTAYRDIELDSRKSLSDLAAAIVASFNFDFDHAFGFYTGRTDRTRMSALPKYELFVDMGEGSDGALSVERTKASTAFPKIGHALTFLFDYGDNWEFKVELRGTGAKAAGVRYPRTVASHGKAPEQYPDEDDYGS